MERIQEQLNQELAKPASEINANLVKTLLDALKEEPPTEEAKERVWKNIIRCLTDDSYSNSSV